MNGYLFAAMLCFVSFFVFSFLIFQIITCWLITEKDMDDFLAISTEEQVKITPTSIHWLVYGKVMCVLVGIGCLIAGFL